jgi:uncharacterized phiE125 gp8 family phage protein
VRFRQAVPPGFPIFTIEEAKRHLRIEDEEQDQVLDQILAAVNARLDGPAAIGVLPIARRNFVGLGPMAPAVRCEAGPDAALVKVEAMRAGAYVDVSAAYTLREARDMTCLVRLKTGEALPQADVDEEAMRITLACGYAADAAAVPAPIKQAALLMTAHWFENRGAAAFGGGFGELPMGVMALLRPYRRATE